jgi:hypothetical protein
MNVRVEVRLVEMCDPAIENTAREVGFPAEAIICRQARGNLPGILRVDTEIVPALVIVGDTLLRKGALRRNSERPPVLLMFCHTRH